MRRQPLQSPPPACCLDGRGGSLVVLDRIGGGAAQPDPGGRLVGVVLVGADEALGFLREILATLDGPARGLLQAIRRDLDGKSCLRGTRPCASGRSNWALGAGESALWQVRTVSLTVKITCDRLMQQTRPTDPHVDLNHVSDFLGPGTGSSQGMSRFRAHDDVSFLFP